MPQLGDNRLVEAHGHELVDRSVVVNDTDADVACLRQRARGGADVTYQRSRIALGHQSLRFLEQQRHPTIFEIHSCRDDIPTFSPSFQTIIRSWYVPPHLRGVKMQPQM